MVQGPWSLCHSETARSFSRSLFLFLELKEKKLFHDIYLFIACGGDIRGQLTDVDFLFLLRGLNSGPWALAPDWYLTLLRHLTDPHFYSLSLCDTWESPI